MIGNYEDGYLEQDTRTEGIVGRPTDDDKDRRRAYCKELYDTTTQIFQNENDYLKFYKTELSKSPRVFKIPKNNRYLKNDIEILGLCFPNYPIQSKFTTSSVRDYIHRRLKKIYVSCKDHEEVLFERNKFEPLSEFEIHNMISIFSANGKFKESATHIYFVFLEEGLEVFFEKLYCDMFKADYPNIDNNLLYTAHHKKCTEFVLPGMYLELFRLDIWEIIRP